MWGIIFVKAIKSNNCDIDLHFRYIKIQLDSET